MTPVWLRCLRSIMMKGRFPPQRRRAKWRANWQFEQLVRKLQPGDIVIDCGANVGKFTRRLADRGATVYAFEPDPYCFDVLTKSFAADANVTLFNKAVGVENGEIALYRAMDFDTNPERLSQSSSVFSSKTNVDCSKSIAVEQIDLVEFIAALPQPVSVLKIDIEGAEVPVIEKLLETGVIDRVGHMFVETHEKKIPELAERTAALRVRIAENSLANVNLDWR